MCLSTSLKSHVGPELGSGFRSQGALELFPTLYLTLVTSKLTLLNKVLRSNYTLSFWFRDGTSPSARTFLVSSFDSGTPHQSTLVPVGVLVHPSPFLWRVGPPLTLFLRRSHPLRTDQGPLVTDRSDVSPFCLLLLNTFPPFA